MFFPGIEWRAAELCLPHSDACDARRVVLQHNHSAKTQQRAFPVAAYEFCPVVYAVSFQQMPRVRGWASCFRTSRRRAGGLPSTRLSSVVRARAHARLCVRGQRPADAARDARRPCFRLPGNAGCLKHPRSRTLRGTSCSFTDDSDSLARRAGGRGEPRTKKNRGAADPRWGAGELIEAIRKKSGIKKKSVLRKKAGAGTQAGLASAACAAGGKLFVLSYEYPRQKR